MLMLKLTDKGRLYSKNFRIIVFRKKFLRLTISGRSANLPLHLDQFGQQINNSTVSITSKPPLIYPLTRPNCIVDIFVLVNKA